MTFSKAFCYSSVHLKCTYLFKSRVRGSISALKFRMYFRNQLNKPTKRRNSLTDVEAAQIYISLVQVSNQLLWDGRKRHLSLVYADQRFQTLSKHHINSIGTTFSTLSIKSWNDEGDELNPIGKRKNLNVP